MNGLVSLRTTTEEHHAQLIPHVDNLLALADMVGHVDCDQLHATFDAEYRFVEEQLVPHMATIERTLYGDLERLMDGRHSMEPMREEHRMMRALIADLGQYRTHDGVCTWGAVEGLALRRGLYRLHSLLKVHLAEEELYLGVLEANLGPEDKDRLARSLEHATAEGL